MVAMAHEEVKKLRWDAAALKTLVVNGGLRVSRYYMSRYIEFEVLWFCCFSA